VSPAPSTLDLVAHDDARPKSPALHLDRNTAVSYGELAELVGQCEQVLRHDGKALVLCAGDRDLPTLLAYLAALRSGHTVAFLPASADILRAYRPEFVVPAPGRGPAPADLDEFGYIPVERPVAGATVFRRGRGRPDGAIHPDTALLLATSGSTGSPKTARLSYSGLAGNTAAVIRALGITAAERGPTTLPIRHAYGLSVLNSHLLAGASVVLHPGSPLSAATWDRLIRSGATSFAAVPMTYAGFGPAHRDLLARSGIRTMTQAGGRLSEDLTMRLARTMHRRGGRFFVMYGQTEATSRIACLHPADLPRRLGSVGTAVPGGTLTIGPAPAHVRAVPGEGAIRYQGPGVMLGYASRRADLARGAEVDVLDTGDLGYLREGYLYLTGRAKRIVKVLGVRASLDDLERLVERPGHPAAVICDTEDVLYLVGAGDPAVHEQQRRQLVESLGIPSRHVGFRPIGSLPRTAGGKVDYQSLAKVVDVDGGARGEADELADPVRPGT
jgi:acyl-CoA synthetase (AMP-forming)/AMP-acid ligase II